MGATLIESNPFLRNPATRRRGLIRSVASSSAIEGIVAPFKQGGRSTPQASRPLKRRTKIKTPPPPASAKSARSRD